jgi:acetyltransferase-like isoleucine patch superfamily enzyme
MISRITPNTIIYLANYVRYKKKYKGNQISPRSFLYNVKLSKKNVICGGNYLRNCEIGDYTYLSGNDGGGIVSGYNNVKIGKYCSLGTNIEIITATSHHKDFVSTFPFYSMTNSFCFDEKKSQEFTDIRPVTIGNDVWIGSNVTILPGVVVLDGAIIGAGAVVTKNVEPYSIVAGCPAKTIGFRFEEEIRDQLIKMKWWDWPEEKIKANIELIMSGKIKEFIENER